MDNMTRMLLEDLRASQRDYQSVIETNKRLIEELEEYISDVQSGEVFWTTHMQSGMKHG